MLRITVKLHARFIAFAEAKRRRLCFFGVSVFGLLENLRTDVDDILWNGWTWSMKEAIRFSWQSSLVRSSMGFQSRCVFPNTDRSSWHRCCIVHVTTPLSPESSAL